MWKRIVLVLVLFVLVCLGILATWITWGNAQHQNQINRETHSFISQIKPIQGRFHPSMLASFPPPIQRYLRYAIPEGTPLIESVYLTQQGVIRTDPHQPWMPLTALQYFSTDPPAFLWVARAQASTFFWLDARDHYRDGRGSMWIRLLSSFDIADAKGPEIDQGALMRYLAEMMWFPTSFLQNPHLRWKPIDHQRAKLTFLGKYANADLTLHVNPKGQLARVDGLRFRDANQQRHWFGDASHYKAFQGIQIPTQVEVAWSLKTGPFVYTRLRVKDVRYNFHRRSP